MEKGDRPRIIPTPKSVSISITGKCNLKCKYCFYANEMTALSDLKTDQWLSFFEKLKDLNVMDVSLTGGEAFTRPDLYKLIDGIISNNMRYNILSNGTLITEKTLKNFEEGKRKIRLDYIQISIDGSKAEIHDKSRPNSFDRAIKALRLLKESGYPVVVRTTINRHNLYDLENIASLLLEDIGLKSFSTNDAMPIGSGCRNEKSVSLNIQETMEAMRIINKILQRYPGRLTAQAGPKSKIKMYAEMEHAKKTGEITKRWKMGYLTACGCVFSKIDILHDGTIVPCCMLPGRSTCFWDKQRTSNCPSDSLRFGFKSRGATSCPRPPRFCPTSGGPIVCDVTSQYSTAAKLNISVRWSIWPGPRTWPMTGRGCWRRFASEKSFARPP